MLRGIPSILSPELLKVLSEMGHGDEIVLADGNFPALAYPETGRVIRCDGHGIPELLEAILPYFPLDSYVENSAVMMRVPETDPYCPVIWETYFALGKKFEKDGLRQLHLDKPEFYQRTRKAYAVVTTSETQLYANLVLRKGVVTVPEEK